MLIPREGQLNKPAIILASKYHLKCACTIFIDFHINLLEL